MEGAELASTHSFTLNDPANINPNNFILTFSNPQDERTVRTEVDFGELLKIKKDKKTK